MKTKIIRQFMALFLVVVLETESFLCNNIMVQAQTNDVPFKLENTTYGIKNSNIKAIKLTVTSDKYGGNFRLGLSRIDFFAGKP